MTWGRRGLALLTPLAAVALWSSPAAAAPAACMWNPSAPTTIVCDSTVTNFPGPYSGSLGVTLYDSAGAQVGHSTQATADHGSRTMTFAGDFITSGDLTTATTWSSGWFGPSVKYPLGYTAAAPSPEPSPAGSPSPSASPSPSSSSSPTSSAEPSPAPTTSSPQVSCTTDQPCVVTLSPAGWQALASAAAALVMVSTASFWMQLRR